MYGADRGRKRAVNAGVDLADLRKNYTRGSLDEAELHPDPLEQFRVWLEDARTAPDLPEPNAMILATVSASGQPAAPSARVLAGPSQPPPRPLLLHAGS